MKGLGVFLNGINTEITPTWMIEFTFLKNAKEEDETIASMSSNTFDTITVVCTRFRNRPTLGSTSSAREQTNYLFYFSFKRPGLITSSSSLNVTFLRFLLTVGAFGKSVI